MKRNSPRSILLAALSICGSLAAAAWLVAWPAEAGNPVQAPKTTTRSVVRTVKPVAPRTVRTRLRSAVNKVVDFGRFEDY